MAMNSTLFNTLSEGLFDTWNITRQKQVDGHWNATSEGCFAKAKAITGLLDLEKMRVAALEAGSEEAKEYRSLTPELLGEMREDLISIFNRMREGSSEWALNYTACLANAEAADVLLKVEGHLDRVKATAESTAHLG